MNGCTTSPTFPISRERASADGSSSIICVITSSAKSTGSASAIRRLTPCSVRFAHQARSKRAARRASSIDVSLCRAVEEALLVRPFPDLVVLDPLRQLVVTHEPYAGKAANISQDAIDLGCHQRPAAEMAMQGDVEVGRRFV